MIFSESAMLNTVKNIEVLTADINKSTHSSVLVTEEATKLAAGTTRSARMINEAVQNQQAGTQQATVAMDQIAMAAQENDQSSYQIVEATNQRQGGSDFEALFRCEISSVLYTSWDNWGTSEAWPNHVKWFAENSSDQ